MSRAPLALSAFFLAASVAFAGCGKSPEEHCAQVHQAACPADHPIVNPAFAYDYKSSGATKTDCEKILGGPSCSSELAEYVDCFIKDPQCCKDTGGGSLDCQGGTSCNQDAYLACVEKKH